MVQVAIFGDDRSKEQYVSGLENYDKLVNIGTEAPIPADVKSSFDFLNDKISK